MKHIDKAKYMIVVGLAVLVPALSWGQTPTKKEKNDSKEGKSVIKLNRLDMIYDDEDYSGIVIDHKGQKDDEKQMYERPLLVAPPAPLHENNVDNQPRIFQVLEDDGAESEDEIIMATFDASEPIHTPKANVSNLDTVIHLVNHAKKQEFCFPTPEIARTSSHFGPRRRRFHYGVDLAMPTGEPVYAAFNGEVRVSRFNSSYGNLIVIRHDNGLETYYAHLSRRMVQPGQRVKAGETIGLCGDTGRSYGSHLHFEIRYRGNAMNPENVVDTKERCLISETLYLTSSSFRKVAKTGASNASASKSGNKAGSKYYKVRSGDTLSKIAKRNGTTVRRLCQLNGLKETSVLSVGRKIKVR